MNNHHLFRVTRTNAVRGCLACIALLGAVAALVDCHSLRASSPPNVDQRLRTRNNCCSALYDLLDQEKDVGKLRLIKAERREVKDLIQDISSRAADGKRRLEQLARRDSTLNLHAAELPPGERATRSAISKSQTGELLLSKGDLFELKLLLTQIEALNYGSHLAQVAADNATGSPQADLNRLAGQLHELYERVLALLGAQRAALRP